VSSGRFDGKVVVITGAGSGIGAAIAERFSREGAIVSLSDINLEALTAISEKNGIPVDRSILRAVDSGVGEEVEKNIEETVATFGKLDVLLNNVGIATFGLVTDCTPDKWHRVVDVTLGSAFFSAKASMPHLIKSKGNIVFTASITGLFGDSGLAVYSAAKGGVTNFTRSLAIDHASDGVRVNAVCPGATSTPRTQWMSNTEVIANDIKARIPMGRLGLPHEMAAAAAFLASDDASYITGVNLPVDGGATATSGLPFFQKLLPDRKA
jgi:meso-butanediol dehydrogenase / (S,S)-butanediol dehydrogenase / diacetyl reductase